MVDIVIFIYNRKIQRQKDEKTWLTLHTGTQAGNIAMLRSLSAVRKPNLESTIYLHLFIYSLNQAL